MPPPTEMKGLISDNSVTGVRSDSIGYGSSFIAYGSNSIDYGTLETRVLQEEAAIAPIPTGQEPDLQGRHEVILMTIPMGTHGFIENDGSFPPGTHGIPWIIATHSEEWG